MKKFSYEKLYKLLDKKGESLTGLFRKGIIKDYPSRMIRAGKGVNIEYIADICRYLKVDIEDVVEIIHEDDPESEATESDKLYYK